MQVAGPGVCPERNIQRGLVFAARVRLAGRPGLVKEVQDGVDLAACHCLLGPVIELMGDRGRGTVGSAGGVEAAQIVRRERRTDDQRATVSQRRQRLAGLSAGADTLHKPFY